jgi:hypothetical protein
MKAPLTELLGACGQLAMKGLEPSTMKSIGAKEMHDAECHREARSMVLLQPLQNMATRLAT